MTPIGEQAEAQLRVLRELGRLLSPLRIRYWLRGGWAVDFLLGQITRPHADLDVVMWARHRGRVRTALLVNGFQMTRETEVQIDFTQAGQEISCVFLVRDPTGNIVTHGIPNWIWRPEALPLRQLSLHGTSVHVVSPQQLLDEKEGYEQGTGRPPRPKDLESMDRLRHITSAKTIAQYLGQ